jgi:hypothetical protein
MTFLSGWVACDRSLIFFCGPGGPGGPGGPVVLVDGWMVCQR